MNVTEGTVYFTDCSNYCLDSSLNFTTSSENSYSDMSISYLSDPDLNTGAAIQYIDTYSI